VHIVFTLNKSIEIRVKINKNFYLLYFLQAGLGFILSLSGKPNLSLLLTLQTTLEQKV